MSNLTSRPPGTSVIAECLRLHSSTPARSAVGRFFGSRPMSNDTRSWFDGALGEQTVGSHLKRLGLEWAVFHAVPVGKGESDIDHVVIGPGGVFTINTKHHRGKKIWLGSGRILVNGQKRDHLRNSRHEAQRAGKLLTARLGRTVPVTPVLALVGIDSITVKQRPTDVVVLRDTELVKWLKRRTTVLGPEAVEAARSVASDVTTWHTEHDGSFDSTLFARFDDLRREDSTARTRRILWGSVLAIAAILAVWGLGNVVLKAALATLA